MKTLNYWIFSSFYHVTKGPEVDRHIRAIMLQYICTTFFYFSAALVALYSLGLRIDSLLLYAFFFVLLLTNRIYTKKYMHYKKRYLEAIENTNSWSRFSKRLNFFLAILFYAVNVFLFIYVAVLYNRQHLYEENVTR